MDNSENNINESSLNYDMENDIYQTNTLINKKFEEYEKVIKEKDSLISLKYHEFENYKKRTEQEKIMMSRFEGKKIIYDLLQIVDDLEFATYYADAINDGLKLIYNKFINILNSYDIKQMDTIGQMVDYNIHEVVHMESYNDLPNGIILKEVLKGYMYHDAYLRYPKVIINSIDGL